MRSTLGMLLASTLVFNFARAADPIPAEPVEIGTTPQFIFDPYLVDNHWALKITSEAFERVLHTPDKFAANPVMPGQGGSPGVVHGDDGKFRIWYQVWDPGGGPGKSDYAVAYAESADGQQWTLPKLGLYDWQGSKENNIVIGDNANAPFLLDLPESARRGFRYVLLYNSRQGMTLAGSHDGIHWNEADKVCIARIHSDTQNAIVYDAARAEFVCYCRAKQLYLVHGKGDAVDVGESRRIARMSSTELWTQWPSEPQTILVPDEADIERGFHRFYGMPVKMYGGIYWGFLWPLRRNADLHTELAVSRDGFRFDRLAGRPQLLSIGADGDWDDGLVFGASCVEVGDEWWLYYAGSDGPHSSRDRQHGIGLAKVRKEGFISMRGPDSGGVIVTRQLIWPGGNLVLNADGRGGEIRVRVSDAHRQPLAGFDYPDCMPLTGDKVEQRVVWKNRSLESRAGQILRLEFLMTRADLYSFRATPGGG